MSHYKLSAILVGTLATISLQAAPTGFKFPPPQQMLAKHEPMQEKVQTPSTDNLNLRQVISMQSSLAILADAIQAANLEDTLQASGPYTIFAPSDKAFAKISPNRIADLMRDEEELRDILGTHIVAEQIEEQNLPREVTTLNGKTLKIQKDIDGSLSINGIKATEVTLKSSNGVIYVIDTVLR